MPRSTVYTTLMITSVTIAAVAVSVLGVQATQLHTAQLQAAIARQSAAAQSRYTGAAAAYSTAQTTARDALKAELTAAASVLNLAAGDIAVADLETSMNSAWTLYYAGTSAPVASLRDATDELTAQAGAKGVAMRELTAATASAAAATSAPALAPRAAASGVTKQAG